RDRREAAASRPKPTGFKVVGSPRMPPQMLSIAMRDCCALAPSLIQRPNTSLNDYATHRW
ncbi:MAG TPA: hypothetical protein VHV77_04020, partial [Pirellulales bacterium]|nr:hypothetical protein [Pirellulales bacterium]